MCSSDLKQRGTADERHLWPVFADLIRECRPATVFGEQVASTLGRQWIAGVRTDLEGMGFAVGAADLCAAGVGAPHIRQRLYWGAARLLANADGEQCHKGLQQVQTESSERNRGDCLNRHPAACNVGDAHNQIGRAHV